MISKLLAMPPTLVLALHVKRQEGASGPRAGQDSASGLQMVKGEFQLEPTLRCLVPLSHNKKKKYFHNCSSCGPWLSWITNLQPLVFGSRKLCSFEAGTRDLKSFRLPCLWGQTEAKNQFPPLLWALQMGTQFVTICSNRYRLVCVEAHMEGMEGRKDFKWWQIALLLRQQQLVVSLSYHTLRMGIWRLLTQLQGEGCYSELPKRKGVPCSFLTISCLEALAS